MGTDEINELEQFFVESTLPDEPVKLDACTTITDCSLFVSGHLSIVNHSKSIQLAQPYYDRLLKLKEIMEERV